ncbi:hypothetical protein EYF80_029259 [Liparis tanakae]|uniref:Uncharacterized protein n=1 Tax=Liparis tanakae TaxID=230148 RepID=A0A4Z2H402_9TELE|nr:hypothetical protein EYF80_029259 [Liparis tanakae]
MATSRRDNNAFNFGLPSILRLCTGAEAAGWLLAQREEEEEGEEEGRVVWEAPTALYSETVDAILVTLNNNVPLGTNHVRLWLIVQTGEADY